MHPRRRAATIVAAISGVAAASILGAIAAQAVSGGGYSPHQQGCSPTADRNDMHYQNVEPGCHNFTAQVNQGGGGYDRSWHVVAINSDQLPGGSSPHKGTVVVDPGRGTAYTVSYDTGTQKTVWFSPLGYVADLAGWVVNVFGGQVGPPPLPVPKSPPPAPKGTNVGLSQGPSTGRLDGSSPGTWQFYLGADDNLDNGEHDGISPSYLGGRDAPAANGPSDGGALQVNSHPQGSASHPAALAGNARPTDLHNPVPAADATAAGCADGLCAAADTRQRQAYRGGCNDMKPPPGGCQGGDVYSDQSSTTWRNQDCNSGDVWNQNECGAGGNSPGCHETGPDPDPAGTTDCDDGSIDSAYNQRGTYYTEPGVQVYEDPDPQASPILPMYPVCEAYAGTEGVYVCGTNRVPAPPVAPRVATSGAPTAPALAVHPR